MKVFLASALVIASLLAAISASARDKDEIPPANAKRLSEIVAIVEAEGHTVITDIDFDDSVWIVRGYKSPFEFEIRLDPVSGEILGIRPTI